MKYIKKYEEIDNFTARYYDTFDDEVPNESDQMFEFNISNQPKIGDFIYLKSNEIDDFSLPIEELEDAKTRIFQILAVKHQLNDLVYTIKSIPEEGRPDYNKWYVFSQFIECFASTIEQLNIKHNALKYNI